MQELYRCRSHLERMMAIHEDDSESDYQKRQYCHQHLQWFVDGLCRFAWSKLLKVI